MAPEAETPRARLARLSDGGPGDVDAAAEAVTLAAALTRRAEALARPDEVAAQARLARLLGRATNFDVSYAGACGDAAEP